MSLVPVALVSVFALSLSILTREPFCRTLPVSLFALLAAICLVYLAGLPLSFLRPLSLLLSLLALLLALIQIRRHGLGAVCSRDRLLAEISSLCLYAGLLLTCLYLCRGKRVWLWDELRLWGAYPKCLFFNARLQLPDSGGLFPIMKSYRPAMPLLAWFLSSFSEEFHEESVFFSYSFFSICVLMPISRRSRRLFDREFLLSAVLILLMPALVYHTQAQDYAMYYGSLFIDGRLGLCFGLALYQAGRAKSDPFSVAALFLSLLVLSQLKDSGVFLALCCLLCWAVLLRLDARCSRRKATALTLLGAVLLLVSYLSWERLLDIYGIKNHLTLRLSRDSLRCLWLTVGHILGEDACMLTLRGLEIKLQTWVVLCVLALLEARLFVQRPELRIRTACKAFFFLLSSLLFLFGYSAIFTQSILQGTFPSAIRYFGTLLLAAFSDFLFQRAEAPSALQQTAYSTRLSVCRCLKGAAALALMFVLMLPGLRHSCKFGTHIPAAQAAAGQILAASAEDGEETACFFSTVSDEVEMCLIHHRCYFDLIGSRVRIANFYTEANPLPESGGPSSAARFLEYLRENGCSMIYVWDTDERFNALYGGLFPGGAAEDRTVYLLKGSQFVCGA